jgi:transcriptional regulator with XRE-family HTH domain
VSKIHRVLGENLREYRNKAGFSQEKLAEKSDLHPVFISKVERGISTISVESLGRIAKALDVRVCDLVRGF